MVTLVSFHRWLEFALLATGSVAGRRMNNSQQSLGQYGGIRESGRPRARTLAVYVRATSAFAHDTTIASPRTDLAQRDSRTRGRDSRAGICTGLELRNFAMRILYVKSLFF